MSIYIILGEFSPSDKGDHPLYFLAFMLDLFWIGQNDVEDNVQRGKSMFRLIFFPYITHKYTSSRPQVCARGYKDHSDKNTLGAHLLAYTAVFGLRLPDVRTYQTVLA